MDEQGWKKEKSSIKKKLIQILNEYLQNKWSMRVGKRSEENEKRFLMRVGKRSLRRMSKLLRMMMGEIPH